MGLKLKNLSSRGKNITFIEYLLYVRQYSKGLKEVFSIMCIIIVSVQPPSSFHSNTTNSDGFVLLVLNANSKSKNQLLLRLLLSRFSRVRLCATP